MGSRQDPKTVCYPERNNPGFLMRERTQGSKGSPKGPTPRPGEARGEGRTPLPGEQGDWVHETEDPYRIPRGSDN